jgi:hypothetical protein
MTFFVGTMGGMAYTGTAIDLWCFHGLDGADRSFTAYAMECMHSLSGIFSQFLHDILPSCTERISVIAKHLSDWIDARFGEVQQKSLSMILSKVDYEPANCTKC